MRAQRAEHRSQSKVVDDRTGLTLSRWDPKRAWGAGDFVTPDERFIRQVRVSRKQGHGTWVWSRRDSAYRQVLNAFRASEEMLGLTLAALREGEPEQVRHVQCIAVTSLLIYTDKWGNGRSVT